jgi:hypothetical protein
MQFTFSGISRVFALAIVGALAACTTPAPPPPPAPPPAPIYSPARPLPPSGAATVMAIPPVATDGVRQTLNAGLTTDETIWNLRSAWNVAALNCLSVEYAPILDGYKGFLDRNAKQLTAANKAIDAQYRSEHGRSFNAVRDAHMTSVYNYFALPPTKRAFCDEMLAISQESILTPSDDLNSYALTTLPRLEGVFENFFQAYERWQIEAAAWDALYAPRPAAPVTPAIVVPTATGDAAAQIQVQ